MSTTLVHPATAPARVASASCWVAGPLFLAYAAWSIHQHLGLRTSGYDLGIFEQAVRGYAHLGAPVSSIKGPGFNLLGDHFHPILAVLGPLYRLFPSPITLLVAQAALIAASSIPITRLASRLVGRGAAVSVGVAYGISWGLRSSCVRCSGCSPRPWSWPCGRRCCWSPCPPWPGASGRPTRPIGAWASNTAPC